MITTFSIGGRKVGRLFDVDLTDKENPIVDRVTGKTVEVKENDKPREANTNYVGEAD